MRKGKGRRGVLRVVRGVKVGKAVAERSGIAMFGGRLNVKFFIVSSEDFVGAVFSIFRFDFLGDAGSDLSLLHRLGFGLLIISPD